MTTSRRSVLAGLATTGIASAALASSRLGHSLTPYPKNDTAICPDPIYEKPLPLSEAEFPTPTLTRAKR